MIRVLVAASSAVVRAGLEAILARDPSIVVVGNDHNDAAAIADEIAEHEPDVVLVEHVGGADDLIRVSGAADHGAAAPAIVMLTDDGAARRIAALVRQRVRVLLPRAAGVAEILAAVSGAAAGLAAMPVEWLTELLPNTAVSTEFSVKSTSLVPSTLTPRELEVLRLIAEGLGNKQIAVRLGISDHTVKFHVGSVFAKLRVSTRAEAVMLGARHGLIVI